VLCSGKAERHVKEPPIRFFESFLRRVHDHVDEIVQTDPLKRAPHRPVGV
jgi:hypothetical protein